MRSHTYQIELEWTGDRGSGTSSYADYGREYTVRVESKPELFGSSDPAFRGDPSRHNPEELLVAALSSCHMLSYLHLCAVDGIRVVAYRDHAEGSMGPRPDGRSAFHTVVLHPQVRIAAGDPARAAELHEEAHRACFIANSVNFPVSHEATITSVETGSSSDSTPS